MLSKPRVSKSKQNSAMRKAGQSVVEYLYEQFLSKFPTDEDCWTELYRNADFLVFRCKYCGANSAGTNFSQRSRKCLTCNKTTWHSAGTFFNNIRKVKAWLAAIWLMERGIVLTSSFFHRLVEISQSSALYIIKKLRMVITLEYDGAGPVIPSKRLEDVVGKRSLETPARLGPQAEEDLLEQELRANRAAAAAATAAPGAHGYRKYKSAEKKANKRPADDADECEQNFTQSVDKGSEGILDAISKKVYELISNIPTSFDKLCQQMSMSAGELSSALMVLTLMGLIDQLPGDEFVRHTENHQENQVGSRAAWRTQNQSRRLANSHKNTGTAVKTIGADDEIIKEFMDFAFLHFIGLSRKHLQLYTSEFWSHRIRYRWGVDRLREACFKNKPIKDLDILAFVTPRMVKMFAAE